MELRELETTAHEIRKDVLRMLYTAGSGHPGSCLSCVELITVLYFNKLRLRPSEPDWVDRDRFVLAKGHAAPVLYAALARKGFIPQEELHSLRQLNSRLQGHPDMKKTPGVDASTGSLGQGLSMANGLALGAKLLGKSWKTYALLGDGECQEGQVWEAAMLAAHYKVDNILAIVDYNGLQIDGPVREVMDLEDLEEKWRAFGWSVWRVNGHDCAEISRVIDETWTEREKPKVIIAQTVKGRGVSFMENEVSWHGRPLTQPEFEAAMTELQGVVS